MGYMTIANGSSCVVVHGTELLVLIAAYFEWNTLPVPLSPSPMVSDQFVEIYTPVHCARRVGQINSNGLPHFLEVGVYT